MSEATAASPKTYQCRHLFTDGHRCGSKSLRHEEFCFYHHKTRKPIPRVPQAPPAEAVFDLPFPEDRAAIQLSIGEILQRIARNQIDPRRAGLLLYGLQIASLNLPKPTRDTEEDEPALPEEIVTHPTHGPLAPIAEFAPHVPSLSPAGKLLRELAADDPSPTTVLPTLQAAANPAKAIRRNSTCATRTERIHRKPSTRPRKRTPASSRAPAPRPRKHAMILAPAAGASTMPTP